MDKIKYKCLLCSRENFDRPTSHYCVGGYRKHKLKWLKIMKTNCGSSPDSITELPTKKVNYFIKGEKGSTTLDSFGTNYLQVVPDSQYFTDLEQILTCLQINWNNQEYMITALKNSIAMGYKLVK